MRSYLQNIADQAYQDITLNPKLTYAAFIGRFDKVLEDNVSPGRESTMQANFTTEFSAFLAKDQQIDVAELL